MRLLECAIGSPSTHQEARPEPLVPVSTGISDGERVSLR